LAFPIPTVTVVIPHLSGEAILRRCLMSLRETRYSDYGILIVDNGSEDGSVERILPDFPDVQVVRSAVNLGFAGGCNLGIRKSLSPFVCLLNNDAVVTPDWLEPLVDAMESDPKIAAVQPKILSIQNPDRFDYSGGAGGEIDVFGYPFARGRVFDHLEIDRGQYDVSVPIFWASGAATLIRGSALERVGLFDEAFFAHMEEIDLDWRMQKAGSLIVSEPRSVVYHQSGGTLHQSSFRKMALNHRNSLVMILKNYEWQTLAWILPIRLLLEGATLLSALLMLRPLRSAAVLAGVWGVLRNLSVIQRGRRFNRSVSIVPDRVLMRRMYRGSAAIAHYLFRVQTAGRLIRGDGQSAIGNGLPSNTKFAIGSM
jgi:GT2 family glycosyltransferase